MAQLRRWVTYGVILMAMPMVAWRLIQLGSSDTAEIERPEAPVPIERADPPSVHASGFSGTARRPETSAAVGVPRTKRRTLAVVPATEQVIVEDMTVADLEVLKQDYSCGLALTARQECNLAYEDAAAYETCLSLRQYYSYSRHCGYQP